MEYSIDDVLNTIYDETTELLDGNVANYIPQLANVNPDLYGICCCCMDGTLKEFGDSDLYFSIQSCSKPINYCLARKTNLEIDFGDYVGYEPSGRAFNELIFTNKQLPHNPMINAGAIMVNSFIGNELEPSDRFDVVKDFYNSLGSALGPIGFDNSIYLSEQSHADRNISLAYEMRSNKVYHSHPSHSKIQETLNLYFQSCSLSINCRIGSLIAATLANGGINPVTKVSVVERHIVKDCLSLMYSCGMYDYSGQFSFEIGLPAKSGVSGCLLLVVPKHYGICIWSPRLDKLGNSVRGVEFCKRFGKLTNNSHHIFNIMEKKLSVDYSDELLLTHKIINAASKGNLNELKELEKSIDNINFNLSDYDGRTALHLACNEGQYDVIKYLIDDLKCSVNQKDRWGNTPLHDAKKRLMELDKEDDLYPILTKIIEYVKSHTHFSDTESEGI
jgi:glutaminase